MAKAFRGWWRANRGIVRATVTVAVILGVGFGLWAGLRAGALVAGSVVAIVGVLVLSSATMIGMDQTLDRQIAMRERDAKRRDQARHDVE